MLSDVVVCFPIIGFPFAKKSGQVANDRGFQVLRLLIDDADYIKHGEMSRLVDKESVLSTIGLVGLDMIL